MKNKAIEINLQRDIPHRTAKTGFTPLEYQFGIQWNKRNTWWTFTKRLRAG